jgi:hypothetical protein
VLSQHVYLLFYSKVMVSEVVEEKKGFNTGVVDSPVKVSKKEIPLKVKKKDGTPPPSVKKSKKVASSPPMEEKKEPSIKKRKREQEPEPEPEPESEPESKKVKRETFDLDEFLEEKREISWENAEIIPSPFKFTSRKSNSSKKKDKMWDMMYDLGKRKKKRSKINLDDWKKEGKEFQKVYNHKHSL